MGFLSRFKKAGAAAAGAKNGPIVPPGCLIYAIGDIHGRDDLFAMLLDRIDNDRRGRSHEQCILILLGDLVDRGPDSDKVIARAISLAPQFDRVHHLIGNHEECMLAALTGDVRLLRYFLKIGGDATIRSYLRDDTIYDEACFDRLATLFPTAVPQDHIDFLSRGEDWVTYGDYMFVHAGVRDGVPLDRQATSDLRWIRDEFLSSTVRRDVVIVHGHTISEDIEEWPNRIGIDTGAYLTGKLTGIGLTGDRRWFLASQ